METNVAVIAEFCLKMLTQQEPEPYVRMYVGQVQLWYGFNQ